MQCKEIITGENNEILRTVSREIEPKMAKKIIARMKKIIKKQPALGLAAPQIGKNVRVILVKIEDDFLPMINPNIISFSEATDICEEGCLSLPDTWGNVERAETIRLEYTTETGDKKKAILSKLNARVVQHEIDHLDGVLFVDKVIPKELMKERSETLN